MLLKYLGTLPFEDPLVALVLGVYGDDGLVVVLGVVGVLDHRGLVSEGRLLRVGELESGGKKNNDLCMRLGWSLA